MTILRYRRESSGILNAIANSIDISIIVYNVPSQTGVDLTLATMERFVTTPTIIKIKDATSDLSRPTALTQQVGNQFYFTFIPLYFRLNRKHMRFFLSESRTDRISP